jgi:hypothetical protein
MSAYDDKVPCPRCGQLRLPYWWYKPGYEWLGHGLTPCIGVDRY